MKNENDVMDIDDGVDHVYDAWVKVCKCIIYHNLCKLTIFVHIHHIYKHMQIQRKKLVNMLNSIFPDDLVLASNLTEKFIKLDVQAELLMKIKPSRLEKILNKIDLKATYLQWMKLKNGIISLKERMKLSKSFQQNDNNYNNNANKSLLDNSKLIYSLPNKETKLLITGYINYRIYPPLRIFFMIFIFLQNPDCDKTLVVHPAALKYYDLPLIQK